MKKIFLFVAAMVCAMSLQAKTIYLDANIWDVDGPTFFVHAWYDQSYEDVKMTPVSGSLYSATIADANSQIIFLRMQPGLTTLDWSREWNRTSDLSLPADKNRYTIECWNCAADSSSSSGSWSVYDPSTPVCPESYGLLIDGVFHAGTRNSAQTSWREYMLGGVSLTAGQTIQVYDTCSHSAWVISTYAQNSYEFPIANDHYTVTEDGIYDFYIKLIMGGDEMYVFKHGSYTGAVPSQCTDVLMQGFYYDSYEVDSAHTGTEQYGDTKWKTLQKQAGEIGAYFDLIWLPPSAYASGTGYHPKQYANQNSAWGSRIDLENLIAAFHNSGTKVVADIVINHSEAMMSWCDMAAEDFDQYGLFEPDMSWICSGDEVNWPENNADTLAGDCWGTATGHADDGENWKDARDWAHDDPMVQDMFKAYLQWMKNVIGYDGWRYDKGDGFNNWHMKNYNDASQPYIAFMECWTYPQDVKNRLNTAQHNLMALDFWTRYSILDNFAGWDYVGRTGEALMADDYWKKYAVTFVDNHDMCLRGEGKEFAGDGQSLSPDLKYRLLGANAFILSMPGVPCIMYPHWAKYKEELKPMIDARHLAGVHSESPVTDEYFDMDGTRHSGYQATIQGKNGYLILCLGTKANKQGFDGYRLIASGYNTFQGKNESYEIWVNATGNVAPGLIVTPSAAFEDIEAGITVTARATGADAASAVIYYTTDGTDPTTASSVYSAPLNFKQTTTLKIMAVCGTAQSQIQTYTYTYREPLQRGIRVRFRKPNTWDKVCIYAWRPYKDAEGNVASENIMGAYPGQRIYQDVDGWFTYEFSAELDSVNFCFNSGDDCGGINVRSNDLVTDYDVCYGWRAGKDTTSNQEELLDCETNLHPSFDIAVGPESGFFSSLTEGIQVTINAIGEENAMIYYTLDGSEPSTGSQSALSPVVLTLKQTTTVKAYAMSGQKRTQTRSATYTYKAPQSGPLTVKFIKPADWTDLYLYAFTRVKVEGKYKDTPYSLDGKSPVWPGMKWTTTDGNWYVHTMKPELKEIYIIFTEGKNKPQTQDIYLTENTCYLWNPGCRKAVIDADCDGQAEEGIEEIIDNSSKNHETYKLIINGHLVIINRGVMYDVLGRRL